MGQANAQAAPNVYGRYETLFRIAAGGMAEVYAARVRGEAGFQKLVALKRMLPHLTDDDRFVTMFMDEGRLAANISSPNVVSTMDLGRADDGSLYLVMELVVGTTLSALLRNASKEGASMPIDVAVEIIAQAAQGLHDAHEARTPFGAPLHIVHRDISPQNILVGTDGRVRITDFGVARAILRRTKTSTGEFKGKLSYFSPEQCADKNLDRRSDIFSLGVVAWETLTTRRLFHAENPLAVLERVTRMPIPGAHTVNAQVPPAIAAVVATALERERDARFSTAAEFANALRAAARDTVGLVDRGSVAELVSTRGGESLERVQRQLRKSLSPTQGAGAPAGAALDEAKTEISSGIVFRSEDGAIVPATPPAEPITSATGASFVGVPAALGEQPVERASPSKAPYIIATLVAAVGLAAGAVIGVMAMTGDTRQPVPDEVQLLPAVGPPVPLEAPASTDPAPSEEPASAAEPEGEPEQQAEPDTRPSRRERSRRRRSDAPRRAPERSRATAPEPPPSATPEPRPRATPEPREQAAAPAPRPAVEREPPAQAAPAPQPSQPRRRGGLVGLEGFDRDIGQR